MVWVRTDTLRRGFLSLVVVVVIVVCVCLCACVRAVCGVYQHILMPTNAFSFPRPSKTLPAVGRYWSFCLPSGASFPPSDRLQLNFNGSSMSGIRKAGCGGPVRNVELEVFLSHSGLLSMCHANEAELYTLFALEFRVEELQKIGAAGNVVEGDSYAVTQWAKGAGYPEIC